MSNTKVGLFFGSFNPVHTGHMVLANYMVEYTDLNEFWFVVSPQNPLKEKKTLLKEHHRLEMMHRAIHDDLRLKVSDIEFKLPKPSYTINTLAHLKEKYPKVSFALIMGSDNLQSLTKWKNYEEILKHQHLYVYPRPGYTTNPFPGCENIHIVAAPLMELSSTFIRDAIKNKKDVRYFMPEKVWAYIQEMNFYKS